MTKMLERLIELEMTDHWKEDKENMFVSYPESITEQAAVDVIKETASRVYKKTGTFMSGSFEEHFKTALPTGFEVCFPSRNIFMEVNDEDQLL